MSKDYFINVQDYFKENINFYFFIGGRGVGKTYSTIQYLDTLDFFIYMRYSVDELEKSIGNTDNPEDNEFYKIDNRYNCKKIKDGFYGIYKDDILKGYGVALATFYKIRGVNYERAEVLFLDEFIPEKNARRILKDPSDALFNSIESINRNREFFDVPPIKVIACANSNNIYNEIFVALNVIQDVEMTLRMDNKIFCDPERDLQIAILESKKDFIEKKKNTSLYRLTKGTKFYEMALENNFAYNDFDYVRNNMSIIGYTQLMQIDNIMIWKKKGEDSFICKFTNDNRRDKFFINNEVQIKYLNRYYREPFFTAILNNKMYFDSYEIKKKIFDIFNIKC